MTSHDVVGKLRRITGEKSIGHLGTLDPMATGVLPLLLGKYTRLAQYFSSAEKSYTGAIRFGFSTDTYDAEGVAAGPDVWPDVAPKVTLDQVRAAAARFHGEMEQMPPPYSAKKIAGTPAYKLAREGKPVELKAAKVRIDSFTIAGLEGAEAVFEMSISAGGYVRSVAHEMGQDLGCGAHLSSLRRTRAGVFAIDESHTLEDLAALTGDADALERLCVHPRLLLPEMPSVTGDAQALGRLRNGAQANLVEFSRAPMVKVFAGQRELAAIVKRVAGTLFQPVVVME
jgi:tRNA pseudouridine55 synthase